MKPQAGMLMALTLLAILLADQITSAAPQNGRPRKGRGLRLANRVKKANAQKNCSLENDEQHYFQVRMNETTSDKPLRGDVNIRALNPWTYRTDSDEMRIPSSISHTVCAGHCSGFDEWNPIEIRQQIYVLKKKPSGCGFTFEAMTIVVGCTCIEADTTDS